MKDEGMTLMEFREMTGLTHPADWIEYVRDIIAGREECPACCDDKCIVERDGYCEHGNPSILLKLQTPIIKGQ